MTLDSTLDKLRNKDLTFGCMIIDLCGYDNDYEQCTFITNISANYLTSKETYHYLNSSDELVFIQGQFEEDSNKRIIGHPLTRGRIRCVLLKYQNRQILIKSLGARKCLLEVWDILDELEILFDCNYELCDQNELQRMENKEVRPKLRELLIQFSNYL